MSKFKKKLLIDLDVVLNEYGKEPFNENFIPEIKAGAKEFLEKLSNEYKIKVFTTRNRLFASKWIIENKLDNIVMDVKNVKYPA